MNYKEIKFYILVKEFDVMEMHRLFPKFNFYLDRFGVPHSFVITCDDYIEFANTICKLDKCYHCVYEIMEQMDLCQIM